MESLDLTVAQAMNASEIEQQIATARKFPRDVKVSAKRLIDLATMDEETAEGCWYRLERGKGDDRKVIEGPSVRLAEMAAGAWGNIRAAARIVEIGEKFVTAQGVAHDMETNTSVMVEVQRSIVGKYGRYTQDMIGVTCNAAAAIAYRNAVFKVVPASLTRKAFDAAKKYAVGDASKLEERRSRMLGAFLKIGVQPQQLLEKLQLEGVGDIQLEHIERLIGIFNAIRDGDQSKEEAFGKPVPTAKELDLSGLEGKE